MTRGATRKNGITNFSRGLWAERAATLYLWCKGYRIRARRYKTPLGEIDVIATRGRQLVFFEIKARATLDTARASIVPGAYKRLQHAAHIYLAHHPHFAAYEMRFDLIAIAPPYHIDHLDNIDLNAA